MSAYVALPYTQVWIKKSFLQGPDNFKWGYDETVEGVLMGFKAIRNEAPLFEVYLPEYGAMYDKILQCAIFNRDELSDEDIYMEDVAWWDCLSDEAELIKKPLPMFVETSMATGRKTKGEYLWTIDWRRDPSGLGQYNVWHEHKQKNFFFDDETGVLCCAPNNKMLWYDKSLTPPELKKPFFEVFSGTWSHEEWKSKSELIGDTTKWDYSHEEDPYSHLWGAAD